MSEFRFEELAKKHGLSPNEVDGLRQAISMKELLAAYDPMGSDDEFAESQRAFSFLLNLAQDSTATKINRALEEWHRG